MGPRNPRRRVVVTVVALAALLSCSPAAAGEVSLKTENYLFAASEALADGDPALALSLLRRAKQEDPDCCIIDEYLCRTQIELGQLDRAAESYSDFVGCMESSDEPVREELEEQLSEARRNAPDPGDEPAGDPRDTPDPATARRGSGTAEGGRPGLVLMGIGGGVAAGFGVTATVTHAQSRSWIEAGEQDLYEARKPLNNASVVLSAVGGGVAVVGLIVELATARTRRGRPTTGNAALQPSVAPGPGQVGLSATWRF